MFDTFSGAPVALASHPPDVGYQGSSWEVVGLNGQSASVSGGVATVTGSGTWVVAAMESGTANGTVAADLSHKGRRSTFLLSVLLSVSILGCRGPAGKLSSCEAGNAANYFNGILNVAHEGSAAAQALYLELLTALDEPPLGCGSHPEEAIRLSQRSTIGPYHLVVHASRDGEVVRVKASRLLVADRNRPQVLQDRELRPPEWSSLINALNGVDFNSLRVFALPKPNALITLDGEGWLFEVRSKGTYHVVFRRPDEAEPELLRLRDAFLQLSVASSTAGRLEASLPHPSLIHGNPSPFPVRRSRWRPKIRERLPDAIVLPKGSLTPGEVVEFSLPHVAHYKRVNRTGNVGG